MSRASRAAAAVLVATLLVALAGVPVYVRPQVDAPRRADAIFVLGGPGYERYSHGIELALAGYAPTLVFSNPDGAKNSWLADLCRNPRYPFAARCVVPDPPTTRGEARAIAGLAADHGWKSLLIVTFRPHVSRARYILARCYPGELIMAESPTDVSLPYWAWTYVYQTAGYARAAFQRGC